MNIRVPKPLVLFRGLTLKNGGPSSGTALNPAVLGGAETSEAFAALQGSAIGTKLPKLCTALCPELAKADVHLTGIRPGDLTEQMQSRAEFDRHPPGGPH